MRKFVSTLFTTSVFAFLLMAATCTPSQISATFAATCAAASAADTEFGSLVAQGIITSQSAITKERNDMIAVAKVCSGPAPTSLSAAVTFVSGVVASITKVVEQAKAGQ